MPTSNAHAEWNGDLKSGNGSFDSKSGAVKGTFNFGTRFEGTPGSNPEELLAAAHASCFSMALAHGLASAGLKPEKVSTTAAVTVDKVPDGFKITKIKLTTQAKVPGADAAKFKEIAEATKKGCPVSVALAAVPSIELDAKLV